MSRVKELARAVGSNLSEDAPVAMLADEWLEQGDGRGEILRRWLAGDRVETGSLHDGTNHYEPEVGYHLVDTPYWSADKPNHVHFNLTVYPHRLPSRTFTIEVPHHEARDIADRLPNADAVHKFLDSRFGPDPRPRPTPQPEQYAKSYGAAITEGEQ